MNRCHTIFLAVAAVLLALTAPILAAEGGGSVKIGYTWMDQAGSLGVNQETFNLYEGVGLSLTDWHYAFNNGMQLQADLRNITLNNRLLEAAITKPGRFSLLLNNNQYRRIYDFDGNRFTRRAFTNARVTFNPIQHIQLFAGLNNQLKHGTRELVPLSSYDPLVGIDTAMRTEDWSRNRYSGGVEWQNHKMMIRSEYQFIDYNDKTRFNRDRTGQQFNATASMPFPYWDRLSLSGGYIYRRDKTDQTDSTGARLTIQQGWAGGKLLLPWEFFADYRIIYGFTREEIANARETDDLYQVATLGKNFGRKASLRVGYENRIKDDLAVRTVSQGVIVDAMIRPIERLWVSGLFSTRKENSEEIRRLLGDQDVTRSQVTAQWTDTAWGGLKARWQMRIRNNDPLYTEALAGGALPSVPLLNQTSTRMKFNAVGPELTLRRAGVGMLNVTYTFMVGTFENAQDSVDYKFRDHVLSGSVVPRAVGPFQADFGAVYYRSQRNQNIEKFNLNFGLTYTFLKNHHLEARYNVFNFDDFNDRDVYDTYYTGNIVEVNLIKDLSF